MNLNGRKVSVLGLGKSGVESVRFLARGGAQVFASESKSSEYFPKAESELKALGVESEFGKHSIERILKSEFVVISPGISPKTEVYQKVVSHSIPLWSEIELAYRFCPAPVIAVTGTNGKTTVTTLIQKILSENGLNAVSCGNIGNPFIGEISRLNSKSWVVLETSSFQLQNIDTFHPKIAVLLNLTDNHYDWHGTFQAYADAKWNIFKNQTADDYAVLNSADTETKKRSGSIRAKKVYFNPGNSANPNFEACLDVARILNLNEQISKEVLEDFRGIDHRMEELSPKNGVSYINDSKSTTIASLGWALDRMDQKVVLIMGGLHKGGDFGQLKDKVIAKVKRLILIGKAAAEIESALHACAPIEKAGSLEHAVKQAHNESKAGDTVLFSPACASFDMFQNYEDRGRQFKEIVSHL